MNLADLRILESIHKTLAETPGVRSVRLAREGETVEVPLSRMAAVVLAPRAAEDMAWPDVPAGRYRLTRWHASVLDRALPGTRAFEALVTVAESCRSALLAGPTRGGLAEDGPAAGGDLAPAVGATRLGPLQLAAAAPGRPTELEFDGASGYWTETLSGAATLDGEALFSSGLHALTVGSPQRRIEDQWFNGLAGGLTLDLGDGGREIVQTGVLTAAAPAGLAMIEAAIEAFIDGRTYTLTAPDGTEYPHCRLERLERRGPPLAGVYWHQPYRILYRQLAR
jgi:hypothetical protein